VVVAGGGIGGLAVALALARRNFRVVVLEQAAEFGEIGAGIQLAPNAWHAIDALGVGELVKKEAVFIERLLMMDGVSGETVIDIPLDERLEHEYSPLRHTDRIRCPVTVAWAEKESAEFARQSREFAEKLRAPTHIGNGMNHFEIIETLADARSPLARTALEMIA